MQRVIVTGATGNLGWKLVRHLSAQPEVFRVVGLDLASPTGDQLAQLSVESRSVVEFVNCDLTRWSDERWRSQIQAGDAIVHFAARNPFPEATWDEANASLDMTNLLALAAVDAEARRFVFASSNHVMGRYKDEPLASKIGPGELTTDLEHGVGTVWHTGDRAMDSTPYAVAKSSGERVCHAVAEKAAGRTTFVCVRIGWCQPGENRPSTLSASGTPTQGTGSPDAIELDVAERWFRTMWLSNRDFTQIFERAILADSNAWPRPCIIVNGTSANTGMKWSLTEARTLLKYEPQDDVARG